MAKDKKDQRLPIVNLSDVPKTIGAQLHFARITAGMNIEMAMGKSGLSKRLIIQMEEGSNNSILLLLGYLQSLGFMYVVPGFPSQIDGNYFIRPTTDDTTSELPMKDENGMPVIDLTANELSIGNQMSNALTSITHNQVKLSKILGISRNSVRGLILKTAGKSVVGALVLLQKMGYKHISSGAQMAWDYHQEVVNNIPANTIAGSNPINTNLYKTTVQKLSEDGWEIYQVMNNSVVDGMHQVTIMCRRIKQDEHEDVVSKEPETTIA
ncbi:MAG: hypothetical protein ACNFW9_01290 [Candidatus Kerfeldbacteria bacterium]